MPLLVLVGLRDRCGEMAPVVGLAPTRTGLKDRALGSLHSRAEKKVLLPGLAPGLRPHLGQNGYKPFVLLYTTGGRLSLFLKWRNAEGMLPITKNARRSL